MTRKTAHQKLKPAGELIFEVESQMNINTSKIRLLGYKSRIAIQEFRNALKSEYTNPDEDISTL